MTFRLMSNAQSVPLNLSASAIASLLYKLTRIKPNKAILNPPRQTKSGLRIGGCSGIDGFIAIVKDFRNGPDGKLTIQIRKSRRENGITVFSGTCNRHVNVDFNLDNPEQYLNEAMVAQCREWAKTALDYYIEAHEEWIANAEEHIGYCERCIDKYSQKKPGDVSIVGHVYTHELIEKQIAFYSKTLNKSMSSIPVLTAEMNNAKSIRNGL